MRDENQEAFLSKYPKVSIRSSLQNAAIHMDVCGICLPWSFTKKRKKWGGGIEAEYGCNGCKGSTCKAVIMPRTLINATVHMNGIRYSIKVGWVAWQHSGDLLSTETARNIFGLVMNRGS
jgi:hypothetical protein